MIDASNWLMLNSHLFWWPVDARLRKKLYLQHVTLWWLRNRLQNPCQIHRCLHFHPRLVSLWNKGILKKWIYEMLFSSTTYIFDLLRSSCFQSSFTVSKNKKNSSWQCQDCLSQKQQCSWSPYSKHFDTAFTIWWSRLF